jgi:hypothetical protein
LKQIDDFICLGWKSRDLLAYFQLFSFTPPHPID